MGTATQPTRNVAFTATENGVSFFLDGKSYVVNREHPGFLQVVEALHKRDYDVIPSLMDVNGAMSTFLNTTDPDFEVKGALVYYKGKPFTEEVSEKVLRMTDKGVPALPLINFLKKVRSNPSATAQRELLLFCAANEFLIHEDGDLIAYKAVREDYLDVHSRTVRNKPFTLLTDEEKAALPYVTDRGVTVSIDNEIVVVSMDRAEVDDRRGQTCSFGLHFAAHNYARSFTAGPRMLVLKLNPADVVSIPEDYDNAKGRCSRYEIMAEIEEEHIKETGLEHREFYHDDDFDREGIQFGCGGGHSHDDADDSDHGFDSEEDHEDEEEETNFTNPEDETREETARAVSKILGAESSSNFSSDFMRRPSESLGHMGVEGDTLSIVKDELLDMYGPAIEGLEITEDTTLDKIVAFIRGELDISKLVPILNDKILRRVVVDRISFIRAVEAQGFDPHNEKVQEALQSAGFTAWL